MIAYKRPASDGSATLVLDFCGDDVGLVEAVRRKMSARRDMLHALSSLRAARTQLAKAYSLQLEPGELCGFLARMRAEICTTERKLLDRLCAELEPNREAA